MKQWSFLIALMCGAVVAAIGQNLPTVDSVQGIQPSSILVLMLRGETSGKVWGTDTYTADSSLAAAAVHAGVLTPGAFGAVYVEVLPGAASYAGSSRYGVTSASWGSFGLSFRFLKTAPQFASSSDQNQAATTIEPKQIFAFKDESALSAITFVPGVSLYCRVTGSSSGRVWGTDVYTSDSSLNAAAVHAGIVQPGQTAIVRITMMGQRQSFAGSTRNGVTSNSYGSYGASYTISPGPSDAQVVYMIPNPGRPDQIPGVMPGQSYVVWVLGQTSGTVWGTDIYTSDSPLAVAAVHAGILKAGEASHVIVHILAGQNSYTGTSRNDITSASYGSFGMSYSLDSQH